MKTKKENMESITMPVEVQHVRGVSPSTAKKKVRLGGVGGPITGSGPGLHPNFAYQGGPIVKDPQVYNIYLGDWTSTAKQTRATRLDQFITDMMNSEYMN